MLSKKLSDRGAVDGLRLGLAQVLHIGVLDQLLGADSCAQAALGALGVVDPGHIVLDGDSALGADLLTQTAADTADGTGTGGSSTLGHGVTGDDHVAGGLNGNDQQAGVQVP